MDNPIQSDNKEHFNENILYKQRTEKGLVYTVSNGVVELKNNSKEDV